MNTLPIGAKLLQSVQNLFVRSKVIPSTPIDDLPIDLNKPISYVLIHESYSDLLSLDKLCRSIDLPSPLETLTIDNNQAPRVVFIEDKKKRSNKEDVLDDFKALLQLHEEHKELDVQLIPVSMFWGRRPGRDDDNFLSSLLERHTPSALRKFFLILFLGRRHFVKFSPAVSLRYMADKNGTDQRIAQKLARVARVHFKRQHRVLIGPNLPQRNIIIQSLMKTPQMQAAIEEEANNKKISVNKASETAENYLHEIAANYADGAIRIANHILKWLWNKVYQGINIKGVEQVRQLAQDGHGIIYVPCHRSHMDYLLLSYILYHEGFVPPHIAAGVNLNFWPAGPIFRFGGAFFLRRSFSGNKLYTNVFKCYLDQLFNKGYAVEFFPEGGRSRTGRLLSPKTGMLAMTVQSVLRGVERPITLVPVYLGYDHVMEVSTYHKELAGQKKKKESVWHVFGALRKLKNYGQCYVNFGKPVTIHQYINQCEPNWRESYEAQKEQKPSWLTKCVNNLANEVMFNINGAAAISSVSLTGLTILASDKHSLERKRLEQQLDLYLSLLSAAKPTSHSTIPTISGKEMLQEAIDLKKVNVAEDDFGEYINVDDAQSISIRYYQNNILHLMSVPSLVATLLLVNSNHSRQTIFDTIKAIIPLLQAELFFKIEDLDNYLNSILNSFIKLKLIKEHEDKYTVSKKYPLLLLSRIMDETLQRYSVLFAVLVQQPEIDRMSIEQKCHSLAQRLGTLNGIQAPEFFDKKLYSQLARNIKQLYPENNADYEHYLQTIRNILNEVISTKIKETIDISLTD